MLRTSYKVFQFLFVLLFSLLLHSQEQLSFIDNHFRSYYKSAGFFNYQGQLRAYTEEYNGAVTVYEYNLGQFELIGTLNEEPVSMPYSKTYPGQFLDSIFLQVNNDHVVISNLGSMETRTMAYDPKRYKLHNGFISYTESYTLESPAGPLFYESWSRISMLSLSEEKTISFTMPSYGRYAFLADSLAIYTSFENKLWDRTGVSILDPISQEKIWLQLSEFDNKDECCSLRQVDQEVIISSGHNYYKVDSEGALTKIFCSSG